METDKRHLLWTSPFKEEKLRLKHLVSRAWAEGERRNLADDPDPDSRYRSIRIPSRLPIGQHPIPIHNPDGTWTWQRRAIFCNIGRIHELQVVEQSKRTCTDVLNALLGRLATAPAPVVHRAVVMLPTQRIIVRSSRIQPACSQPNGSTMPVELNNSSIDADCNLRTLGKQKQKKQLARLTKGESSSFTTNPRHGPMSRTTPSIWMKEPSCVRMKEPKRMCFETFGFGSLD